MSEKVDVTAITKFNGENYQQWKFQLICAIQVKGILDIVKGEKVRPTSNINGEADAWDKKDALAMFIVTSVMEFKQIALIENCNTSFEVFIKLNSIYEQKMETNKFIHHDRFYQYEMSVTGGIAHHITKVEFLARQIRENGDIVSDLAIMIKIISTLPIKYKGFRQAWMSTLEDNQTLNNLTARLLDEEANITVQEEHDNALATTSSGYSSKNRKYTIKCHRKGHLTRDCRSKPKEADDENKDKKSKESNDGRKYNIGRHSNYTAFSSEMCTSSLTDVDSWILDSGASNHMTDRKEFFSTFETFSEESFVRLGKKHEFTSQRKRQCKNSQVH